jgi:hypothetical protein
VSPSVLGTFTVIALGSPHSENLPLKLIGEIQLLLKKTSVTMGLLLCGLPKVAETLPLSFTYKLVV